MQLLTLQCPKCHSQMKYQWNLSDLANKRKMCVYCGKGFSVRRHMIATESS